MVDAHWMYSRRTAQEIGLKYQELGVHWLEAPLIPEDLDGYRELAGMLRLQIAMGECERSPAQFANVLNSRAADILQPDVGRAGGITGVMRIAAMAAERQVNIAPHCGVGLGAYAAAGLHVAAAIPNLELLEYQPEMHACIDRLIHERFDVHDGHLSVPDRPGLGITYDEAELARYLDA
jgi:galactonate dehydratase